MIIGSSMTGLVVSHALSKEGVRHILIGGPEPDESPRLGESMNEGGSLACWRLFGPEFRNHFHTKSHISLLNGNIASLVSTGNPHRSMDDAMRSSTGRTFSSRNTSRSLVHLDRSRFDPVLYRKVRESHYCEFIENQKVSVRHDPESDRITSIDMGDDGVVENPSFVFDATGPFGIAARAAGVGRKTLSDRQRTVWTHYWRTEGPPHDSLWWLRGTNLLKLDQENDALNAIAWLIPLGDRISVGLSVSDAACPAEMMDKESMLNALDKAYARRGVDYRAIFPETKSLFEMTHQYSICDRAYGANWVLVGRTFVELWFPSSAGMSTATMVGFLARRFLDNPEATGRFYEAAMRRLLPFHEHIATMVNGRPFTTRREIYKFWAWWLASVLVRKTYDLRMLHHQTESPRLQYTLPERFGWFLLGHPLLLLSPVGFLLLRVRTPHCLKDYGAAFGDYFCRHKFHRRNLWEGWRSYLASKRFD